MRRQQRGKGKKERERKEFHTSRRQLLAHPPMRALLKRDAVTPCLRSLSRSVRLHAPIASNCYSASPLELDVSPVEKVASSQAFVVPRAYISYQGPAYPLLP